jgi:hypothetical protein
VRELVRGRDDQHRYPREQQRVESVQPREIPDDLIPVAHRDPQRDDHSRQGQRDEPFREKEPDLSDEAIEEAVGIECFEPDVKRIASKPLPGMAANRWFARFEESKAAQLVDELLDDF